MRKRFLNRARGVPGVVWLCTSLPLVLGPIYALIFFSMANPSLLSSAFSEGWTFDLGVRVFLDFLSGLSALYAMFAVGMLFRSETSWNWLRALAWSSLVVSGVPGLLALVALAPVPIPFFWVPAVAAVCVIRASSNRATRSWIFGFTGLSPA